MQASVHKPIFRVELRSNSLLYLSKANMLILIEKSRDDVTSRMRITRSGHFVLVSQISRDLTSLQLYAQTLRSAWWPQAVCTWASEAGCWHTQTKICPLSHVSDANTSSLVSKTIDNRDRIKVIHYKCLCVYHHMSQSRMSWLKSFI